MLDRLGELKRQKLASPAEQVEFCGLDVLTSSFSIYEYHLRMPEEFDIFIAKNIPNSETPRVHVQIRSRMLVLEGEEKAIERSYSYVEQLLDVYDIKMWKVSENRVDFAYHTNLIQNISKYITVEKMKYKLISKARLFNLWGKIGKDVEVDTFSLGNRKSNNVFFRLYNKTREVIEKNYKSFFFRRWLDERLISKYDFYCLNVAFEAGQYVSGLLKGRIEWYLEYGKNDELKEELRGLLSSCYEKSDNLEHIKEKLKGVLPEVTLVTNCEFQCKRKFFTSCEAFISEHRFEWKGKEELHRLFKLLHLRREFMDYNQGLNEGVIKGYEEGLEDYKLTGEYVSALQASYTKGYNYGCEQGKEDTFNLTAIIVPVILSCAVISVTVVISRYFSRKRRGRYDL